MKRIQFVLVTLIIAGAVMLNGWEDMTGTRSCIKMRWDIN